MIKLKFNIFAGIPLPLIAFIKANNFTINCGVIWQNRECQNNYTNTKDCQSTFVKFENCFTYLQAP